MSTTTIMPTEAKEGDLRDPLITRLNEYLRSAASPVEREIATDFLSFVRSHARCFDRELTIGHITASGWVLRSDCAAALLLRHRKLGVWLQPGGHADGDSDLERVARREVEEETGVCDLHLVRSEIFDLDIHPIPPRGEVPAHLHYDVRFLFTAPEGCALRSNSESTAIAWVPLDEVGSYSADGSVLRMARKSRQRRGG